MDATEFEIEAATRQTEDEIIAEHFVSHYKATVDAELEGVVDDIVESALAVKTGEVLGTEQSNTGQYGIFGEFGRVTGPFHGDSGSAARFFYAVKGVRQ